MLDPAQARRLEVVEFAVASGINMPQVPAVDDGGDPPVFREDVIEAGLEAHRVEAAPKLLVDDDDVQGGEGRLDRRQNGLFGPRREEVEDPKIIPVALLAVDDRLQVGMGLPIGRLNNDSGGVDVEAAKEAYKLETDGIRPNDGKGSEVCDADRA